MIYLVAFLAVLCGVLAFLLGQKPKVITEVKHIEVISELPTSIPTYRDWLDEDIEVRDRLLTAMESSAMRVSIESSTTTIALDSPDIKGRIIGREGRNLKSFEQITGVELVIDDTENIVTLSSFDPYRREVATQTLKALIKDGKIQPSKIEEFHQLALKQVDNTIQQAGESAAKKLNLTVSKPIAKEDSMIWSMLSDDIPQFCICSRNRESPTPRLALYRTLSESITRCSLTKPVDSSRVKTDSIAAESCF